MTSYGFGIPDLLNIGIKEDLNKNESSRYKEDYRYIT